jgi:hypothetical protein
MAGQRERVSAPLPLRHPLLLAAALFTAAACAFGVTFRITDPDLWQHLTVGRAIWQLHHVPVTNLWVWPLYGAPDICPSWLFRALLWPFWSVGDVLGIYAWRWLTTLAAFALLWAAARRMGARGFSALFVIALAALSWRHRSQARPETLVAVLLSLELWLLIAWREGGRAKGVGIAIVLWTWVNAHISWPLGFAVLAAFGADAALRDRRRALHALVPFVLTALAALALAFANPAGVRGVMQPFDYWRLERNDPLYFTIVELRPRMWSVHWRTGLPLLVAGWPLLIAWRAGRRTFDLAEVSLCALFTYLALASQRFAGLYALVAVPFVARDLAAILPRRDVRPALAFAALIAGTISVSALEWSRADVRPGIGFDLRQYPIGACDFIEKQGLHGPVFCEYFNSGYLLWRFWPDRSRLPFMDIHQSGTDADRKLYPYVFASADAWRAMETRHAFELLLVDGSLSSVAGDHLPDFLDADPSWALVFRDDNACVYVRRDGVNAAVAAPQAYARVPGGTALLPELGRRCAADSTLRRETRAELERQIASSKFNARASSLLANIAWIEGRTDEARTLLAHALDVEPGTPFARERLARIAAQPR